ncbi:hypothetical protein ScPMuIL_001153 [Solemya velum]
MESSSDVTLKTGGSMDMENGDSRRENSVFSNGTRNGSILPPKQSSPPPLPKNPPRNVDAGPPRIRISKPPDLRSTTKFIPEQEIIIPADGNLQDFSTDDMSTFFRHLGIEERIVSHLHRKNVDGKRFAQISESNLEILDMNNPIVLHFRDRTRGRGKDKKKKNPFLL